MIHFFGGGGGEGEERHTYLYIGQSTRKNNHKQNITIQ